MLLYSQNPHSQGAKRLARELGIRRIRHHNSLFRGIRRPWVINWGATAVPLPWGPLVRLLNAPEDVQMVSNKLLFFTIMNETGLTPSFETSQFHPKIWLEEGKSVVERHILNGHGGAGIRIVDRVENLQEAPLYVEYIPKKAEYRVHIFDGEAIDVQRKIRKPGEEPINWQVRTHDNGFIYVREMMHERTVFKVREVAQECMRLTDLLFGAVDVIYNERQDRAYVLEINTAPGLEGQTVVSYANAIREYIRR